MARPKNLAKLLKGLTEAEIDQLRELVKENPEVTRLKAERAKLMEQVDAIDAKLSALTGTKTRKAGRKPGRKPAAIVDAKPKGKPGRKPGPKAKAVSVTAEAPKRRGRPPMVKPDSISGEAEPKKRGRKPMTDEQRAAVAERLAKGRAAAKAKVKRTIVDNDLITSPSKG